jgi:protein-S-isoprenylcysteine O-methyltransferase Ste14
MMAHSIFAGMFLALWGGWLLYWLLTAGDVTAARWHEPIGSRLLHIVPFALGMALLAMDRNLPPVMLQRLMPHSDGIAVAGAILTAAGLGIAVWARRRLGRNWSGTVTLKEGHTLVRDGPYRVIRHPIYSGLLLAIAGTALAIGQWRGIAALALASVALARKVQVEERVMAAAFPDYAGYRRRSWALIPFVF